MSSDPTDDSLTAWEEQLWAAEADLREREERALVDPPTPRRAAGARRRAGHDRG